MFNTVIICLMLTRTQEAGIPHYAASCNMTDLGLVTLFFHATD